MLELVSNQYYAIACSSLDLKVYSTSFCSFCEGCREFLNFDLQSSI